MKASCIIAIVMTCAWLSCHACSPGEGSFKAAAMAVKITPQVEGFEDIDGDGHHDADEPFDDLDGDGQWDPTWMGGYQSERPATGILHDLWARILVVEGTNGLRAGIVSADWVGLFYDQAKEIERKVSERGVRLDLFVLSSTHNHQSPDTMGLWGPPGTTGRDAQYFERSAEAIASGIEEAVDRLEPATMLAGQSRTHGLTRDSRLPKAIDERVTVLQLLRIADSSPIATVVHWPNHPEVFHEDNQMITPDFPHALIDRIEARWQGAVGIYWQGTVGGLLTPLGVEVTDENGNPAQENTWEKAEAIGYHVFRAAEQALEAATDFTADGRILPREEQIFIPLDNEELRLAGAAGIFERTLYDEYHEPQPAEKIYTIKPYMKTEVTALSIGDFAIVGVPGELYPELALEDPDGGQYYQDPQDPGADFLGTPCSVPIEHHLRAAGYSMWVVLGLANDELGYIIPKCQFDREPPYCYGRDSPQYGEELSVGPEAAPMVVEAAARAISAVTEGY